jgi:hypothetical protein
MLPGADPPPTGPPAAVGSRSGYAGGFRRHDLGIRRQVPQPYHATSAPPAATRAKWGGSVPRPNRRHSYSGGSGMEV